MTPDSIKSALRRREIARKARAIESAKIQRLSVKGLLWTDAKGVTRQISLKK